MHIIQMAQEHHAIYLGMPFLDVLGKFYRNRKGFKSVIVQNISDFIIYFSFNFL